jgi:uncharacterized protein (TIGR02611 family)
MRRLLVVTAGFTLCGAGLIMLVLPGPGVLVAFLGLLVLATEYPWAERAVQRTRARAVDATTRLHATRTARIGVAMSATALITGGAAAAVILDGHRYLGISALVAGVGALAVLVPAIQRLLDPPIGATSALEPVVARASVTPTPPNEQKEVRH